jgi:4-methylaminobutanoate oxidase (formaldehyde-forming)
MVESGAVRSFSGSLLFHVFEDVKDTGILLACGCAGAGISVAGGVGLGISKLAGRQPNPFDFSPHRIDRFGAVDPYTSEHQQRCAAARSNKISG